ncbi:MAG: recombinase family protein [Eubacterium coprostanoligenes]|nr:recombinase family protein [Eubacterium coprostanoligenes]
MANDVVIIPAKKEIGNKLKVAAYARVSMNDDEMLHSLNAQVNAYIKMIKDNPLWEFVEVFYDKPMTGTKENRPEFQRMLEACRNGKIDMVITKSISRFARNTKTTLKYTRELKALNVDVFFEENSIHTLSSDGEFVLTIMAAFAQSESLSVSENIKWRIKREYEEGNDVCWRHMYGFNIKGHEVSINENEAKIIRAMFEAFANGIGATEIARRLREQKIPTRFGGTWTEKKVRGLLRNEKYKGDTLLQKRYVNNHLDKHCVKNKGMRPQYYVEDSHPAIVDAELFDKVQRILDSHKPKKVKTNQEKYPFTGKLQCDCCGKNFKRRKYRYGDNWMCSTFAEFGKDACPSKQIKEDILLKETAKVLGLPQFDEKVFSDKISHITVCNDNILIYHFKNGKEQTVKWEHKKRSDSWTPEMRQAARERANKQWQRK